MRYFFLETCLYILCIPSALQDPFICPSPPAKPDWLGPQWNPIQALAKLALEQPLLLQIWI